MFTYHHNSLEAYYPIAVAMLDAGLVCSASLPCPAEMGGSIHINKTASSIVDTVFVCRRTGTVPRRWIAEAPQQVAALVREDVAQLRRGEVQPTQGDIRCITFGHMIRLAVWFLRSSWQRQATVTEKLAVVARQLYKHGGLPAIEQHVRSDMEDVPTLQQSYVQESVLPYELCHDYATF